MFCLKFKSSMKTTNQLNLTVCTKFITASLVGFVALFTVVGWCDDSQIWIYEIKIRTYCLLGSNAALKYKYLIVKLVFSHLGCWSGNLFLIAPFPGRCLLVLFK